MQISGVEYGMILHIMEELEKLKQVAEKEFDNYCANRECIECALYKNHCIECTATAYFDLRDKGEI